MVGGGGVSAGRVCFPEAETLVVAPLQVCHPVYGEALSQVLQGVCVLTICLCSCFYSFTPVCCVNRYFFE